MCVVVDRSEELLLSLKERHKELTLAINCKTSGIRRMEAHLGFTDSASLDVTGIAALTSLVARHTALSEEWNRLETVVGVRSRERGEAVKRATALIDEMFLTSTDVIEDVSRLLFPLDVDEGSSMHQYHISL